MGYGPGTPYYPLPVSQAPRRRTGLWVAVAIGLVVLLVLVAGGAYLVIGAAVAGGEKLAADRVLERARQDNNAVFTLITPPNLGGGVSGSDADLAKLKSDLDAYRGKIGPARTTLAGDMPQLREQSSKLGSDENSFLLAPQRATLDGERQRLQAALTAFTNADQALVIADDQLRFASALMSAAELFSQVGNKLTANDLAGALAVYGQLDPAMQQVVQLAKSPNIPKQMQTLTTALATTAADIKQLVQAVRARDLRTVNALTPKIDADQKALESFDENAAKTQTEQIFQPYKSRYEAALKSAGFKVV